MGDPTGFRRFPRVEPPLQPVERRLRHWNEFVSTFPEDETMRQAARCMDCGTPFCQSGCPVYNQIPDWNEMLFRGDWRRASEALHSTNNFPEITGRVCPAPCEASCTLAIGHEPVSIKGIELAIAERAWREKWVKPELISRKTGKRCAVIGSGPAGLACAQQLARAGHAVTVFEKQDRLGGLLRYGIPDFRLNKKIVERRLQQMREEGVVFRTHTAVGETLPVAQLMNTFDAVVLACGAEQPRDLDIPGRGLKGIYYAWDYLSRQNRRVAGDMIPPEQYITARNRDVVVIGGGDTGSDCIGAANRQGARSVTQIQYHEQPPKDVDTRLIWPDWPCKLRTTEAHEEGCTRLWGLDTVAFEGRDGCVCGLELAALHWERDADGVIRKHRLSGSYQILHADLVLLAMGYAGPRFDGLISSLGLVQNERGNVSANDTDYRASTSGIFVCGDMRRGQSLVVWAIREGRQAAHAVDLYLMGQTNLPYC